MKISNSYNIQIWVGLREKYTEKIHTIDDVRKICEFWVNSAKHCITITPTEFWYVGNNEPGVIIGFIQYPRFPIKKKELRKKAHCLAYMLMKQLNQNRVTITTPNKSYMLKNKGSK